MILFKSIKQQTRWLVFFLSLLLVMFTVVIISLIFIQFSIGQIDVQKAGLIRQVNRLAVGIQQSGDRAGEDLQMIYSSLLIKHVLNSRRTFSPVSRILPDRIFSAPEYINPLEKELYRVKLRNYARTLQENEYLYLRTQVIRTYTLLIVLLVLILGLFFLVRAMQKAFMSYMAVIDEGVGVIDGRLNYQSPVFPEISTGAPEEIRDFHTTVERIDKDIRLDQFLDNIESYGRLADILAAIAPVIQQIIPFDRIALAFNDLNGFITAESAWTSYQGIHLAPGRTEILKDTSLPEVIRSRTPRIIPDLARYARNNSISESTRLILMEGIKSSLTVPLYNNHRCVGFLFLSSLQTGGFDESHLKTANRVANKLKIRFYHEFLTQEVIAETANSFVALMNEKDNETSAHLTRMARYSYIIARNLASRMDILTPRLIREIHWFAPLHDVGKIGIPDSILGKPGRLTDEEFGVMKGHVELGARVLRTMNSNLETILEKSLMQTAVDIIRGHHERFDGTGYPAGLKGHEIPLPGRIVALADVFDALTSKRSYKKAFTVDEALRIMNEEMSGAFDPVIMDCFLESMDDILAVYSRLKEI